MIQLHYERKRKTACGRRIYRDDRTTTNAWRFMELVSQGRYQPCPKCIDEATKHMLEKSK